jgi:hypothetical protein
MYRVFLNNEEIGTTALEHADPPMALFLPMKRFAPAAHSLA